MRSWGDVNRRGERGGGEDEARRESEGIRATLSFLSASNSPPPRRIYAPPFSPFPLSSSVKREKVPSKQLLLNNASRRPLVSSASNRCWEGVRLPQATPRNMQHTLSRGYALGDKRNPLKTNTKATKTKAKRNISIKPDRQPKPDKPSCALCLGCLHEE